MDAVGGAADDPSSTSVASSIREYQLTETVVDVAVHFQVVDLGRQLFVWVGTDDRRLGNLYATGLNFDGEAPAVSALLPGGPACTADTLAQRIAAKQRKPVLCSWNIPSADAVLQGAVEKRLFEFLATLP